MIYSSVKDNWQRITIMNSIAQDYFKLTENTDFRSRMTTPGSNVFPFNAISYNQIETESCVVGMLMSWSVIALESIINHLIAEQINNKILATLAIEYPSQIVEKLKLGKYKSELAKKIIILTDAENVNANLEKVLIIADKLAAIRNGIVHDKPFDYIDHGDGEITIEYFQTRENDSKKFHYHEIENFYKECDSIIVYLASYNMNSSIELGGLNFHSLYTQSQKN